MSGAQQQLIMKSALALGKLDLSPGSGAAGVNSTPGREQSGQRPLRPQGPAHLDGCVPLSHQVAGHKYGVDKVGILQHPDGTVLKQVQPPPRGPREMQFYSMVYADDCSDPCLLDLQNHLPKYYGTWASPDSPSDLYLKLEDVTRRFARPCIMDVKLGQQSYDPYASQEKRDQQIKKYPLMEEIGFLILGMRVYNSGSDTFDSYDQHYGRGLVKETVKDGLAAFFHNGDLLRGDVVLASIRKVQRILQWFESQRQLAFYASSLLFVYEGLPSSMSSLHIGPPGGPPALPTGDGGPGETRKVQEGTGRDEEVAEYNNNVQMAGPWDRGPTNNRKFAWGNLHDNGEEDGPAQTTTSSDSRSNASTRRRAGGLKASAHANRNRPLLDGKEEDGQGGRRDRIRGGGAGQDNPGNAEVEVKMIDFAHVFQSDSRDHGYIYGLKHLLTVLEQVLCDAAQTC